MIAQQCWVEDWSNTYLKTFYFTFMFSSILCLFENSKSMKSISLKNEASENGQGKLKVFSFLKICWNFICYETFELYWKEKI